MLLNCLKFASETITNYIKSVSAGYSIHLKKSITVNLVLVRKQKNFDLSLCMNYKKIIFEKIVTVRTKLEDLKVLRRSPDLLNNVKIGQGQLQLIMEQILFYYIWGLQTFWSSDLNNLMNNPSNSPVISEKQMFR